MNMVDGGIQVKADDIEIMHFSLEPCFVIMCPFPLRQSLTL